MKKEIIKKSWSNEIYLEYDSEKYIIKYAPEKEVIILMRKETLDVLEIFSDKLGFIVQRDIDGQTSFVVTDYSELSPQEQEIIRLRHYKDFDNGEGLHLLNEFECSTIFYEDCFVSGNTFIVEQKGYAGKLYNLKEKSNHFNTIYADKKIANILGENVILVSEVKWATWATLGYKIQDTITYGIDPETFEIVTPIWSELQQRYIPLYTEEQVNQKKDKHFWLLLDDHPLKKVREFLTIHYEVDYYLERIADYFGQSRSVYTDSLEDEINEPFVRAFKRN